MKRLFYVAVFALVSLSGQAQDIPPPNPPEPPCLLPFKVTAWPSTNSGKRSITIDVGSGQWAAFYVQAPIGDSKMLALAWSADPSHCTVLQMKP